MSEYIEDEDGAPYPTVYAVSIPGHPLYIPYPGGRGAGSSDAAFAVVNPNRHLGYRVVECQLVPVDRSWTPDDRQDPLPLDEHIRNGY